ncbi:MAG: radical SAM family heme chaperone HemW [Bacteroidota bacterium]
MSLGIYIHVPFCRQACSYCDFYFVTREEWIGRYVDALEREIRSWTDHSLTNVTVDTLYFGGGTPSRLNLDQLERLSTAVCETFPTQFREVTLEMNPDDVGEPYLTGLLDLGITRASMGVQTFDPDRLAWMNRSHTAEQAHHALELLSTTGFDRFTVDLIYGSPDQTIEDLERDVHQLLSYDPPHISAYSLTIEPRTRLGRQAALGRLVPAEEEEVASQMRWLVDQLSSSGLPPYEVSNYSKPGREALHNRNYWNHTSYLGFGPGAHSFIREGRVGWRWSNESDLRSWVRRMEKEEQVKFQEHAERLDRVALAEERLMLGLRTVEGVRFSELDQRYGYQLTNQQQMWLKDQIGEGTVRPDHQRIVFTPKGRMLADYLVVELIRRGE